MATFTYTSVDNAPFAPAPNRKKRRAKANASPVAPSVLLDRTTAELFADAEDWFPKCLHAIRHACSTDRAICLGLGSPSTSRDARAQLAFLLRLSDDLQIPRKNITIYDPIFTEPDITLLGEAGLNLIDPDEISYEATSPTLLFMPHCDAHLYERVLRANWDRDDAPLPALDAIPIDKDRKRGSLKHLRILGNCLSEYTDSIPTRKLERDFPCLSRIVPHLTAHLVTPPRAFPTAFNNTAVQYIAGAQHTAQAERRVSTVDATLNVEPTSSLIAIEPPLTAVEAPAISGEPSISTDEPPAIAVEPPAIGVEASISAVDLPRLGAASPPAPHGIPKPTLDADPASAEVSINLDAEANLDVLLGGEQALGVAVGR
ncbi:hypothetical protein PLICRDRAFT_160136 [Plicaturopsis crispa FD-325 SS-3]|nr:hypothetical protein PLICRDRAFT_160136 [Plicaturopsis crispa FD-325 SS-3]